MDSKPIVVVIPTAGRARLLERTIASLSDCELPRTFDHLSVVENGTRTGAQEVVTLASPKLKARYVYSNAKGKSAALNELLDSMSEALVIFLDDDIRVDPRLLVAYANAAIGSDGGMFLGGPFGVDYEQEPGDWLKRYLPGSACGWRLDATESQPIDTPCFLGFNWAAFASDLKRVGGFSPLYGPGSITGCPGQETEAQCRLLQAGVVGRYVPDAKVWHYVPRERCSPQWVVERSYRRGIRIGFERGSKATVAARLAPATAALAATQMAAVGTRLLPLAAPRQFAVDRYAALRRGYLRGLWLRLKHPAGSYQPRPPGGMRDTA
jgi:GT2 family glycosyltransferase